MQNWLGQIVSITRVAIQTIPQRKGASAAALFGIAGVVAVFTGVLSIGQGFRETMKGSGAPDGVIVLRSGADTEMMSALTREETRIIADAPGLARRANGPMASAELFVIIDLPKRATGTDANVPLRGVESAAFEVRDEIQIVEGRRFEPGRNEVIAGMGAAREFQGLELGSVLQVGVVEWTVVGFFTANGGLAESEIWTDAAVLQPAYRRGDTFQAVHVRLESVEAFDQFSEALANDPRLNVKAVRQEEFYLEQSQLLSNLITRLGFVIAGLMGLGAIFGALNTMYTAVSSRTREIATLRALGFGRMPVIISVLAEALLLGLAGGVIGGGLVYLLFDGYRAATMNFQSFSQVAFAFAVTPQLLLAGIFYAVLIGMIGGLFPAIRAARMPVATALRET
jgi:putative ABC transport system permease protein